MTVDVRVTDTIGGTGTTHTDDSTASAAPAATAAAPAGEYGPADWDRVMAAVAERKRNTWLGLKTVKGVRIDPGRILLVVAPEFEQGFRSGGHADILLACATEVFGGSWTVEVTHS